MSHNWARAVLVLWVSALYSGGGGGVFGISAWAACTMERERPGQTDRFIRHLGSECSEAERAAQAIKAEEVLAALEAGKGVDLAGVVLTGDLLFDALPPVAVETIADAPPVFLDLVEAAQLTTVRHLGGSLTMTNSLIRGAIGSRTAKDYLVIQEGVVATGTTFEQPADFSRTVFLGSVDLSGSVFAAQAFFIAARFAQPVRFEQTSFGPHTRFHKAVLSDTAIFRGAAFNGLAELLEVVFARDADFSRTKFRLGSGFSGSRFRGRLDMSEAVFEREAFFTFTEFEQDAVFRGGLFKGTADFSDARFQGADDFSRAMFTVEPRFVRVNSSGAKPLHGLLSNPRALYGLAGLFLTVSFFLVWHIRRQ